MIIKRFILIHDVLNKSRKLFLPLVTLSHFNGKRKWGEEIYCSHLLLSLLIALSLPHLQPGVSSIICLELQQAQQFSSLTVVASFPCSNMRCKSSHEEGIKPTDETSQGYNFNYIWLAGSGAINLMILL